MFIKCPTCRSPIRGIHRNHQLENIARAWSGCSKAMDMLSQVNTAATTAISSPTTPVAVQVPKSTPTFTRRSSLGRKHPQAKIQTQTQTQSQSQSQIEPVSPTLQLFTITTVPAVIAQSSDTTTEVTPTPFIFGATNTAVGSPSVTPFVFSPTMMIATASTPFLFNIDAPTVTPSNPIST